MVSTVFYEDGCIRECIFARKDTTTPSTTTRRQVSPLSLYIYLSIRSKAEPQCLVIIGITCGRRGSSFKRSQPLTIHALEELVTAYRNAFTSSTGNDLLSNPLRLVDASQDTDLELEKNQSGTEEREEAEEKLKVGLGDALRWSIGRFQPDILDWLVRLDGDIVSYPLALYIIRDM